MSDLLLPRIAAGDERAIRECIDRYGGLVWSLARRLLYAQGEVDDAVQEVFVELWRNAYRYDATVASETAFVAMIARRRLIDRRRKLDRRPDRGVMPASVAEEPAHGASPEVVEEAAVASKALEQLSPEQQRCLRLSIYEGLSHEKISESTGLPLGTVKTHVRRGLIRVRELLSSPRAELKPTGGPANGVAAPTGEEGER